MAKDPAFLFYPNDWIGGTMGMTFEEKGAYMELLMMQFNRGHMTSHMCGQSVGQLWDKVKVKFIQDADGLWYNERLDKEKENRKTFTNSRRNNLSGKNQYSKKEGHIEGHTTSRMEDENVNEDRDSKLILKDPPSEFKTAWDAFIEMRKKIRKPATPRAVDMLKTKLQKLSGGDLNRAIEILDQSTLNNYQDLYELKTKSDFSKGKPGETTRDLLARA